MKATLNEFENAMLSKGWVRQEDGSWSPSKHEKAKAEANRRAELVAGLANSKCEPDPLPALEQSKKTYRSGKKRLVLCVKIISIRNREADSDNIISGAKPLRDAIAKSLGVDDHDKHIRWEYEVITTAGGTGTQVVISRLL